MPAVNPLDINQKVVLIAGENELLIDSSGLDRTIPIYFQGETSDQWYNEPQVAETELFGERMNTLY